MAGVLLPITKNLSRFYLKVNKNVLTYYSKDMGINFMKALKYLILIVPLYFLNGCTGELSCSKTQYPQTFDIASLFSITNYKDTFHLYDTLWIRAQIPDTFSAINGACNITMDSIIINNPIVLGYGIAIDSQIPIGNKPLFFRIGSNTYNNFNLIKIGNYYTAEVGVILDNKNITRIGADASSQYIVVSLIQASYHDIYPCRYKAGFCPAYSSGFYINTTFQNQQVIFPLVVK
jgi:hypothetical protein